MLKVSIIIPVYNAQKKIRKAISSILNQTMDIQNIEIILVDDCSKDNSVEIIQSYCNYYPNIKLIPLERNSGSPSRPRNVGVRAASSDYIIFLDADDILLENACHQLYSESIRNDYDIVRGYLKVIKGNDESHYSNRLSKEDYTGSSKALIANLIAKQSTTVVGIYKRSFLLDNNLTFSESIRMGEDTLFLSKCYANTDRIQYIDECIYEYVKRDEIANISSTQSYGTREVNDHLTVWSETEDTLKGIGLDYSRLRLHVGFRAALESMLNFSNGLIPEEDFKKLGKFLHKYQFIIPAMQLKPRLSVIVNNLLDGDYESFTRNTRKRIVINGYDLKFIKPLIPYFQQKYEVEIDEWKGHEAHDEERSRSLLEWADVIFCEWMLGNAEWYAEHKKAHQFLYIRMHRFELFQQYGNRLNIENVDAFIAVGMHYYEEFINMFNLPREKVRLIPNHVDYDRFNKEKDRDFHFNIAVLGALPARKRLDLAVELVERLIVQDNRFQLHIIGSKPEDVTWLWKNETERTYYEHVYTKINSDPKLKDAVIFAGWQDSAEYLRRIGFVISVSDSDKPESFHLAPAEGMASGAVGLLLKWPGVEYIYPADFTADNIDEMANKIVQLNKDLELFHHLSSRGKEFIQTAYSISTIAEQFDLLIRKDFLRRN
ncbi:glycosyltransferase [Paenibacillus lycopersici]|uniref:Glycosyltransferase n=1 Tax=Paenibacillus lycopersici TaxID=2704462 RepID=A0A6C0FVD3_9BACL|nr:glycosyltransferase [Paenibacillus lycopersici]QHT59264.1 glycosyltransferase [Paenibacillus lycopersici]